MVSISGRPAKPGHQVAARDIVIVEWPHRRLELEVLDVPAGNVSKDRAQSLYNVLSDERQSDDATGFESG